MNIRPATLDDVLWIAEANRALARETEDLVLDAEIVTRAVSEVLADPARGSYLVAEERSGEGLLGQLLVTREWSDWRNGWYWWVQSVYVAPAMRRRGVYRELHAHVLAASRAAGALALKLYVDHDNERARATYRSLGMKRARYDIFEIDFPGSAVRRDRGM